MAINPGAREYVLGQMAQVPELRGGLAQLSMAGRGSSGNVASMLSEFKRLNPNDYNRYDPALGQMTHDLHSAGWGGWGNDPAKQQMIAGSELFKDVSDQNRIGGSKHFNEYGNRMEATAQLRDLGITDMDQIGVTADKDGNAVFYSKLTGQALPNQLRGYKSKGQTTYYLNLDDQGNVVLDSNFQKDRRRSGLGRIAPGFTNPVVSTALGIGAGFLVPGLGNALGSALGSATGGALGATAGTALAGAGVGALHAGITGGDIGKSALLGGLGGGLGTYLQGTDFVKGMGSNIAKGATVGGLTGLGTGALGAALYGGDPLKGGLGGAIVGGLGGAGGAYFGGDPKTVTGRLTGLIGSKIGSTFGQQLAGNLVGSPFDPRGNTKASSTPAAAARPIPAWLPLHAQRALAGLQGGVA